MSSNYNSPPLASEVLVEGIRRRLIRRRQSIHELLALKPGRRGSALREQRLQKVSPLLFSRRGIAPVTRPRHNRISYLPKVPGMTHIYPSDQRQLDLQGWRPVKWNTFGEEDLIALTLKNGTVAVGTVDEHGLDCSVFWLRHPQTGERRCFLSADATGAWSPPPYLARRRRPCQ